MKKKVFISVGSAALLIVAAAGGLFWFRYTHSQTRAQVLMDYMQDIEEGKYKLMYELLDEQSKAYVDQETFIERNQNIYEGIEAADIQVSILSDEKDKALRYETSMETVAGTLIFQNQASFSKKDGKYYLQWDDSIIFPDLLRTDKVRVSAEAAHRGNIFDREGSLLAGDGQVSSVGLVPEKMSEDPTADLERMAELLDISVDSIQKKLDAGWVTKGSFVPVKSLKKVSPLMSAEEAAQSQELDLQNQLLEIPGVMISDAEDRVYPLGEKASLLVGYIQSISAEELKERSGKGYTAQSRLGKSGLESLYEERLHGADGCKIWIQDEAGENKEILVSREVKDGEDIVTTIDSNLQTMLYEAYAGDQAASVAMNPYTGEVLALVSAPGYDDNDFILGMSEKKWKELNEDERQPMYNRFRASWVPGSALKPIIGGIGLSTGTLGADEDLGPAVSSWKKDDSWGNYEITTLHTYEGPSNLEHALIYSDNIYFAKAALKIGKDTLTEQLNHLGFETDIPFDIVMKKSQYENDSGGLGDEITLADSGYGQGQMLVNPLHMAAMYTAFVNDGKMMLPRLEYDKEQQGEAWVEDAFTPEAARSIQEDLIQVIENPDGTGHNARIEGIPLAGKTGTAEIKASKEDVSGTELGWFNVFTTAPTMENPLLLVSMAEDVKDRGGSGYVVDKTKAVLEQWFRVSGSVN